MKYIMILFLALFFVLDFVLNRKITTLSFIVIVTYKLCIFLAICICIIYLIRVLARTVGFSGSQIITCFLRWIKSWNIYILFGLLVLASMKIFHSSKNSIISILNLILLFSAVACYLILLNAFFIVLSYDSVIDNLIIFIRNGFKYVFSGNKAVTMCICIVLLPLGPVIGNIFNRKAYFPKSQIITRNNNWMKNIYLWVNKDKVNRWFMKIFVSISFNFSFKPLYYCVMYECSYLQYISDCLQPISDYYNFNHLGLFVVIVIWGGFSTSICGFITWYTFNKDGSSITRYILANRRSTILNLFFSFVIGTINISLYYLGIIYIGNLLGIDFMLMLSNNINLVLSSTIVLSMNQGNILYQPGPSGSHMPSQRDPLNGHVSDHIDESVNDFRLKGLINIDKLLFPNRVPNDNIRSELNVGYNKEVHPSRIKDQYIRPNNSDFMLEPFVYETRVLIHLNRAKTEWMKLHYTITKNGQLTWTEGICYKYGAFKQIAYNPNNGRVIPFIVSTYWERDDQMQLHFIVVESALSDWIANNYDSIDCTSTTFPYTEVTRSTHNNDIAINRENPYCGKIKYYLNWNIRNLPYFYADNYALERAFSPHLLCWERFMRDHREEINLLNKYKSEYGFSISSVNNDVVTRVNNNNTSDDVRNKINDRINISLKRNRDLPPLTSAYSSCMLLKYKWAVAKELCGQHIDPNDAVGKRIDSAIYQSVRLVKKAGSTWNS